MHSTHAEALKTPYDVLWNLLVRVDLHIPPPAHLYGTGGRKGGGWQSVDDWEGNGVSGAGEGTKKNQRKGYGKGTEGERGRAVG